MATESGAPLAATRQAASALGRDDQTKAIEFDRGHVGSRRDASERLHASDAFGRRRFLSDASIVLNRIGCSMIKMPRGQRHRPLRPAGSTARRMGRARFARRRGRGSGRRGPRAAEPARPPQPSASSSPIMRSISDSPIPQNAGIAGVEAEGREQLGMVLRAAGREHRQIALGEALVRALVDAVERIHQAIAERIGVDVERRMDEMADIGSNRSRSRARA